jgi:hypothetical protein
MRCNNFTGFQLHIGKKPFVAFYRDNLFTKDFRLKIAVGF